MESCENFVSCGNATEAKFKGNETENFKKSVQKGGIKSIRFPVVLSSTGQAIIPKGFTLSHTGLFAIYIKAKNKFGDGKVHYELSIDDTEMDTLLVKDHFLKTR